MRSLIPEQSDLLRFFFYGYFHIHGKKGERHVSKKDVQNSGKLRIGLALLKALVLSLVTMLIGAAISAWLILGETVGQGSVGYLAMASMVLGCVAGVIYAASCVADKKWMLCGAAGGIYFVALICINALLFDGVYHGLGAALLLVMGVSLAVSFVMMRKGSRKNNFAKMPKNKKMYKLHK